MTKKQAIKLFEEKKVRTVWDDEKEQWYFCVVDVVEVLTESKDPSGYIKTMKRRDPILAKGWGQIITPLSVQTAGGRQKMNCATIKANSVTLSYLRLRLATTCFQITRKRKIEIVKERQERMPKHFIVS